MSVSHRLHDDIDAPMRQCALAGLVSHDSVHGGTRIAVVRLLRCWFRLRANRFSKVIVQPHVYRRKTSVPSADD